MEEPPAEDVADSRSNVVGRKRALHTSSEQDREVVSIDSSSDESAKQPRKRARQNTDNSSIKSARVEVDLTSSPLQKDSAGTVVKPRINIGQPVAWNQGVQSGLRTSFQSKKSSSSQNASLEQPEPVSYNNELGFFSRQSLEVDPGIIEKYKGALTAKQLKKQPETTHLAVMTAHTKDASALIDLHGWPVPKEFEQNCMKYIEAGLTFYPAPRKKGQPVGTYTFSGQDIQLRELLTAEGKPIIIEDISYPDVIRALVANSKVFKNELTDKRARAAFKAYLSQLYAHVPQRDLFASSLFENAPSAKTILKSLETSYTYAETFSKTAPPVLARAVDHYDMTASLQIIDNGSVEDEAPIEQNNASASNATTDFDGKKTTLSDDGSVIQVADDQSFEASRETSSGPEPTPEERVAILKYFPTTNGGILKKCLVCGSSRHNRTACPDNACSSCGSKGDHLSSACPQTMVCGKCRGEGHQTSHCPEKLRVAKEDMRCITCQSPGHLENECHLIWRSFFPGPDEIKKVQNISVYCYFCGRSGHFGPECGLHRGTPASGGTSWSTSNMDMYLTTGYDAMSTGGNDYSIPSRGKKGFSIKGKANDPIELDDSDDNEGFIHPPVNHGPKNGQIQFSRAGAMQAFNQVPPFQFQGNISGNPNNRPPPGNRGGRGGHRGGSGSSSSAEKKKSKHKSGNSPPRGGGGSRGKAYRGRGGGGGGGGGGSARGAPRGRR